MRKCNSCGKDVLTQHEIGRDLDSCVAIAMGEKVLTCEGRKGLIRCDDEDCKGGHIIMDIPAISSHSVGGGFRQASLNKGFIAEYSNNFELAHEFEKFVCAEIEKRRNRLATFQVSYQATAVNSVSADVGWINRKKIKKSTVVFGDQIPFVTCLAGLSALAYEKEND